MTLDGETIDALSAASSWDAQVWLASVRHVALTEIKYAREVSSNRRRAAVDCVYREHIRKMKRECERRRRARKRALS